MRKQTAKAAKNVLMRDGKARRVPDDRADELIANGQATRFISNTVFRAMKFGIEVTDFGTRDDDGTLRAKIREARERTEKRSKKEREKAEREARELADEVSAHYRDD